MSLQDFNLKDLYAKHYVDSTYENIDGIRKNFKRIIQLPSSHSDNKNRVCRVDDFCRKELGDSELTLLDVGSGLGVFPYEMKRRGWDVVAIDPDSRAVEHLKDDLEIEAVLADFFTLNLEQRFSLITLNKVLEHVDEPVKMLRHCKEFLKDGGIVYIEVPDGEGASSDGFHREEFFIDHIHVFSFTSLSMMVRKAGFREILIERLQEPSSKYTLRCFCRL